MAVSYHDRELEYINRFHEQLERVKMAGLSDVGQTAGQSMPQAIGGILGYAGGGIGAFTPGTTTSTVPGEQFFQNLSFRGQMVSKWTDAVDNSPKSEPYKSRKVTFIDRLRDEIGFWHGNILER